jgi:hypothetical protein
VKDRWAADWVRWSGYGPFFAAVVRAIARDRPQPLALDVTSHVGAGGTRNVTLSIEARDSQGRYRDSLKPVVRVQPGSGVASDLTARQVAPGRYEATVAVDRDQPLTISLGEPNGGAGITRYVVPDPDAEYRLRPPDEAGLRAIATGTGGVFAPSPADLRRPAVGKRTTPREGWPWLVFLACLLWPADIAVRRVRLFEAESGL